ncbi:MAG: hypothetical protein ACRBB0_08990 [Pelagimonas sp.]|uniref:hypothetical protein n=1 Tax=Pelagimonas sp. TaxID=2073170 RepID=UPI003D6B5C0E
MELHSAKAVNGLRHGHNAQLRDEGLVLSDGIFLSWDSANGDVDLDVWPELGVLFQLKTTVKRSPKWLSLNIALGQGLLSAGDIVGLVIESEGCAGDTLPVVIRNMHCDGMRDTYLQQPLQGTATRQVQTLLHRVGRYEALCNTYSFHTLWIALPTRSFTFELRDLRLFVLPAERDLSLGNPVLAAT